MINTLTRFALAAVAILGISACETTGDYDDDDDVRRSTTTTTSQRTTYPPSATGVTTETYTTRY